MRKNFLEPLGRFVKTARRAATALRLAVTPSAPRRKAAHWERLLWPELDSGGSAKLSDPMRQHAWVYACVSTIARKVAGLPFVVASRERDARGVRRLLPGHPAARLLARVNPWMTRSELWQATVMHMYLFGEALWLLESRAAAPQGRGRGSGREPHEIWLADPNGASPIVSPQGRPLGWKVRGREGREVSFAWDETLHFRFFHPGDPARGLSPLEPARSALEQDHKAARHNEALLENHALPGGVISVPEGVSDEDMARLRKAWRAEHQGPRRAGRVAWLMGGMQFSPLAAPGLKDMDFVAGRRFNREEILAVFGVPPAEVQVYEYANYANAEAQARKFWHNTLIPLLMHMEEVLEASLFRPRWPEAVGYFDLANVEDLAGNLLEKSQAAERFWRMGLPFADINERLELGFDTDGKPWLHEQGGKDA